MPRTVTPRPLRGRRRAPARRGLTLPELLITLTILSVVMTLLAVTMLGQRRFYQRNYELSAVQRELRTAMSLVP